MYWALSRPWCELDEYTVFHALGILLKALIQTKGLVLTVSKCSTFSQIGWEGIWGQRELKAFLKITLITKVLVAQ